MKILGTDFLHWKRIQVHLIKKCIHIFSEPPLLKQSLILQKAYIQRQRIHTNLVILVSITQIKMTGIPNICMVMESVLLIILKSLWQKLVSVVLYQLWPKSQLSSSNCFTKDHVSTWNPFSLSFLRTCPLVCLQGP